MAQRYGIGLGTNITTFNYTNDQGILLDFLKPSAGQSLNLIYEKAIIDTSNFIGKSSPISVYLNRRNTIKKVFSSFYLLFGLIYNQYNSVGDFRGTTFNYQTDFVGFQFGLGPEIDISEKFKLSLKLLGSCQKLINGNQLVNNQYLPLNQNPQFSTLQIFGGFQLALIRQISNQISLSVVYQSTQTFHAIKKSESVLNFAPINFQFTLGIKI